MKKIIFASLALFSMLAGYSQSGDKNLQTRAVSGFQGVEVSGGIDLYLSSGPESVAITASSTEIRDHIITEVVGGVLRIHLENDGDHSWGNPKMKAYVSMQNTEIPGSLRRRRYLPAGSDYNQRPDVRLSGGGNIRRKINADHLAIEQSGGSNVNLSGNVKEINVGCQWRRKFERI